MTPETPVMVATTSERSDTNENIHDDIRYRNLFFSYFFIIL